jgi:hypothetical protein
MIQAYKVVRLLHAVRGHASLVQPSVQLRPTSSDAIHQTADAIGPV